MSDVSPAVRRRLVELKAVVAEKFNGGHWSELAALTDSEREIEDHPRLLRALSFQDEDYEPLILPTLLKVVTRDPENLSIIEQYLVDTFDIGGESASTAPSKGRRIVFTPSVFDIPEEGVDQQLVAVMMPFSAEFEPVFGAIKAACDAASLRCLRVKDIWEHSTIIQDVFGLIFRSNVVICDFSGRNPNVFYEAGIAHTLGKQVIPLSQSPGDVPFDVAHHRYLSYLNNGEGLATLSRTLCSRLETLIPNSRGWNS
ncbi:MAG: hypothetical protein Q8K11_15540 [Phenylobacterium sp.]|uniref:hypothetical protein n=1 Tax=Phenylobacterium sp. TaxID=1871053 RepID=UPI0027307133|nr:hypothetical protein [Phenylobacterium sp.]MDP2011584.1 hypothetical protein [Phenylobacterium sp.]